MALSENASGLFQRIPFTAAAGGATAPLVSESTEITCIAVGESHGVNGDTANKTEFLTIFASMSTSGATATLSIFCADDNSVGSLGDGKLFQDVATLTAGALRQSHNTAAGNYVATVAFNISGKNTIDVHPGRGKKEGFPKWYAALTTITGGTATIWIAPGRSI